MYTEGFDEIEGRDQGGKSPRRAYVSNVSQDDAEKLMRENEKLKAALEKEQFFNKLLDQEIQELKSSGGQHEHQVSDYWYGNRGVSKGAFYTLLFITLGMAAYIGYGIYYDKQFDYLKDISGETTSTSNEAAPTFTTPSGNNQSNVNGEAQPKSQVDINNTTPGVTGPSDPPSSAAKDSVPNIISKQPLENKKSAEKKKTTVTAAETAAARDYDEVDVETELADVPAEPVDTRPVIARYRVTSKANFYSAPDENKMRSVFISRGEDKIVGALEDKNGFIYVVYTNDLGSTTSGWLSKKDLSKME